MYQLVTDRFNNNTNDLHEKIEGKDHNEVYGVFLVEPMREIVNLEKYWKTLVY